VEYTRDREGFALRVRRCKKCGRRYATHEIVTGK
jgi:transcriptional regulator NrdR family protein